MGCGCKKGVEKAKSEISKGETLMNEDQDYVLVKYLSLNKGKHGVVGASTHKKYGYRRGGDVFLVHREDVALQPHLYEEVRQAGHNIVTSPPSAPPPPQPIAEFDYEKYIEQVRTKFEREIDPQTLPGVTPVVATRMRNSGLVTKESILSLGEDGLQQAVSGIGAAKAKMIIEYLNAAP